MMRWQPGRAGRIPCLVTFTYAMHPYMMYGIMHCEDTCMTAAKGKCCSMPLTKVSTISGGTAVDLTCA